MLAAGSYLHWLLLVEYRGKPLSIVLSNVKITYAFDFVTYTIILIPINLAILYHLPLLALNLLFDIFL